MARYIKSYSNYVLKKKHQTTNDGVIYERDITTIGGRDQFAKGQIPIYKSGNFVITTNNDNTAYKKTSSIAWEKNDTGEDVWTLDILENYEKDEKSSFDKKIVIKKDYYDLRDFAYYGSCSELIRASINNILKTYPGELYIPINKVWESSDGITFYTEEAASAYGKTYTEKIAALDVKYTDTREYPNVQKNFVLPDDVDNGKNANLFVISNPFGIDVHSKEKPIDADVLKYFAELGYKNYVGYKKIDGEWDFDNPLSIIPGEFEPYEGGNKHFNGNITLSAKCDNDGVRLDIDSMPNYDYSFCPGDYIGKLKVCFYRQSMEMAVEPQKVAACESCDGGVKSNINISFNESENLLSEPEDCITIYVFIGDDNEIIYFVDLTEQLSVTEGDCDNNGNLLIKASAGVSETANYRIRPKQKIIDEYYDSLDIFERLLLDDGNTFTSHFEVINENDYGYYTKVEHFTFPTTYGGYNLGGSGITFKRYLDGLIKIGEFYDERFSDNLWRSMTHESIKNFDWTYTRHYTPGEEAPFVEGGEKIQKIIRLYGREFDDIKGYIDAIKDNNTITYNNVNNLPDYFFTDKLEDDGWDVKLINPLKLTEYVDGIAVNIPEDKKEKAELTNEYACKKLERVFNYDFDIQSIKPYSKDKIESVRKTKCDSHDEIVVKLDKDYGCDTDLSVNELDCDTSGNLNIRASSNNTGTKRADFTSSIVSKSSHDDAIDFHVNFNNDTLDECVNCDSDGKYTFASETGESQKDGYHDDCCNFVKIYTSEKAYKMSEINSEFLKRFILNSKEILRHKGTIEGIEMLLGLFGLRSKNYVLTNETYFKKEQTENGIDNKLTETGKVYYKKKNVNTKAIYDYDIKEYTLFTTRIEDEYDNAHQMYKHDWINSIKLGINRNYQSYQGLTVAYRSGKTSDDKDIRYLYPNFQSGVKYDGNPYYQMNGGWLSKKPFMFDVNNNIIPVNFDSNNRKSNSLFTETVRNIKCVQTLKDLLGNKSLAINAGDICQVIDLTGKYAIVDGTVYDLYDETEKTSYFYATIENNSMSVGNAFFTDYVYVSNPYAVDGIKKYDLNDDSNNSRTIKIYTTKRENGTYDIDVHSNTSSISTFTVFENGKYMDGDNFTNYFRVNNPDFFNELSVIGWQQLRKDEYDYYILDSINDNNKGNNPHTGHMNYDNGYEYLTYFSRIFKYSYDNSAFDTRKMDDGEDIYSEIYDYGFDNLIDNEDDCNKDYDNYLKEDTKCHYFGDIININGEGKTKINEYDINNADDITVIPRKPVLSFDKVDVQHYGDGVDKTNMDAVTNQIVNTKRVDIDFYINSSKPYSNEWLEEVKYIDSVILPYLSQMLPSTIICSINYKQTNICK